MKLSELARSMDTTTASVKFYIRAGLLPPGRKINQTTAIYDEGHQQRLALILGLRGIVGTPLSRIGNLVAIIDDPDSGQLDVMETAQTIGVEGRGTGLGHASTDGGETRGVDVSVGVGDESCGAGDVAPGVGDVAGGLERASAAVARLVHEQDWPDVHSQARVAVERRLVRIRENGVDLDPSTLSRVAAAVGSIGLMGLDVSGTRDQVALGVAVGTYEVSQLVVDMLSLAQTSHSIRGLDL